MKTLLHSCGSLYPIIPDLIDAGYDVLNPVQTSAHQMDAAVLKREFGKDITFWGGGCNTRTAGIAEMLLQSHDGCIDLLPALPSAWKDGCFDGLVARGGFKVSAEWQDGRVIRCRINGGDGKPFRVKINGETVEARGAYAYR